MLRSNVLTNKGVDDIIDNNVLEIARYVREDKYTKVILYTDDMIDNEYVVTPHEHPHGVYLPKNSPIYFHCWANSRYIYNENMSEINILRNFENS